MKEDEDNMNLVILFDMLYILVLYIVCICILLFYYSFVICDRSIWVIFFLVEREIEWFFRFF